MKRSIIFMCALLMFGVNSIAQVGINEENNPPNSSAMLDVSSNNKGFLPPRMTHSLINAISSPADGLIIYCTDCGSNGLGALTMFMGGTWYTLNANCLNPPSAPIAASHVPSQYHIVWNWNPLPGATGYKWNNVNNFATAIDMGTTTTKTETGLIPGNTYSRFVWAYSSCGTSVATTLTQTLWYTGQGYGGGVLFYYDTIQHFGLVSAFSDQGSYWWGYPGWGYGAYYTAIGKGEANTLIIFNAPVSPNPVNPVRAADYCYNLVLNGYDDWFLPSKDELYQMYLKKDIIGGFNDGLYWCSSEYQTSWTWGIPFYTGVAAIYYKGSYYSVRPIRAFYE